MTERIIREQLAKYLKDRITHNLDKLINEMECDASYSILYPLILLEEIAMRSNGNLSAISNQILRASTSWYLSSVSDRNRVVSTKIGFNYAKYQKYKRKYYPFIEKCFQDFRNYLEVCDHDSYAHSKIDKINDIQWRLTTSLISDKYNVENIYFQRLFERSEITQAEIEYRVMVDFKFFEFALFIMNKEIDFYNNELIRCVCK